MSIAYLDVRWHDAESNSAKRERTVIADEDTAPEKLVEVATKAITDHFPYLYHVYIGAYEIEHASESGDPRDRLQPPVSRG